MGFSIQLSPALPFALRSPSRIEVAVNEGNFVSSVLCVCVKVLSVSEDFIFCAMRDVESNLSGVVGRKSM